MFTAGPAHAALDATRLVKIAQNPVGNLISMPFQNNTNLNYGPEKKTRNVLNIQPVIPVSVNSEMLPSCWMRQRAASRKRIH